MDETMYLTPKGKKLTRAAVAKRLLKDLPVQASLPLGGSADLRPVQGCLFTDTTRQQTRDLLSSSPEGAKT